MTPPLETLDETLAAYRETEILARLAGAVRLLGIDAATLAELVQRQHAAGIEPSAAVRAVLAEATARHAGPAELADMLEGRAAFEQFCTTHDAGGGAFRMYVAPLRETGGRQGGAG